MRRFQWTVCTKLLTAAQKVNVLQARRRRADDGQQPASRGRGSAGVVHIEPWRGGDVLNGVGGNLGRVELDGVHRREGDEAYFKKDQPSRSLQAV
jgi:hypothetical protein